MSTVLDPSRELRFTRSRQAVSFALLSSVLLAAVITLLLTLYTILYEAMGESPYWWGLIPLLALLGVGAGTLSYHCMSKPYIIMSALGVELFPFWRPFKNFQLVPWGSIEEIEIDQRRITLHFDTEKKSGIVLTTAPLSNNSQKLLIEALGKVILKRNSA